MSGKTTKVLHIMPIPVVPLIGPCFRCLRQLRGLKDKGMEVYLLCLKIRDKRDSVKLKNPIFEGIKVLPLLPNLPSPLLREAGTLCLAWKRISATIADIKPDIVHVHNPPDTLAFVTSLVCSLKKVPYVYDIHDSAKEVLAASEFNPFLKKVYIGIALFFERQAIKRASGIVTVSASLKKLLLDTRDMFKYYKPYFTVMRNVDIPPAELREAVLPIEEENYIFYSGTLYSKFIGLEFLIDALKDLLISGRIKLYIAGDGPYKKTLDRLIAAGNLSDSVRLIGYVTKDEIISLTKRAKITVIPYERNTLTEIALPNKLFEYMAVGKPVVYPDFPGFREVLGDDNEGKYQPDDKNDLALVIKKLLSDDALRQSLGEKNKRLLQDITFDKEFSNLLNLYRLILGQ